MVVSIISISETVTSILYLGVGAITVTPRVLVRNVALAVLIWRIGPWFLVEVAWNNSVWVVVMDVGILGLFYCGVGAGTVVPWVLGRNIAL